MGFDINKMFGLKDDVAVVTGAAGGIGLEIARGLSMAGAKVIAVDISKKDPAYDTDLEYFEADVTDEKKVDELRKKILEKYQRIDILINCAGVVHIEKAEFFDVDKWDFVMDVNVKGTMIMCKVIGAQMVQRRKGRIVNFSSVRGLQGKSGYLAYATSKGAVNMLTKTLAVEWAKYNVNVNAIAPVFTLTDLNKKILDDKETYEWVISRIPKGRLCEKSNLTGPVIFLCSSASEFITGDILYVDGGWTAG
jgi:NAD(P)-dependent dehydrogenase (short-subunit alcohol dehydrogenase family)